MAKPIRVQRKRTKDWKMPPNTVYVGRPSKWGNPFKWSDYPRYPEDADDVIEDRRSDALLRHWAKIDFESCIKHDIGRSEYYPSNSEIVSELRGKNLACWCPLDQPCHADVLLELANEPDAPPQPV